MGIKDIIKKKYNDIKDVISENIAETPVIKATMMGPRAVGKTSIMASIFSDTRDNVSGTQLYFRPSQNSSSELINKRLSLMNIFSKRIEITDEPQTGAIAASNTVTDFTFEMGFVGRKKTVDIEIKDFPGEFLTSKPNDVAGFIDDSHVVIVAIDSPYLMENDGLYNEDKNEVQRVTAFLTNHAESIKDKLILLVPLKCERYFHDDKINSLKDKVMSSYSQLINFCKTSNIACAITPIQTLGEIEFDSFIDNTYSYGNISKISKYRFTSEKAEYKPLFCVQPLYYLLTYVANYYEWSENQPKNFWGNIRSSFVSMLKDNDEFFIEIKKMSQNILIDRMGYAVVVNNTIFNIKK